MMSIMTRYHTYPEDFKNRIQRVCGNGTLWQLLEDVSRHVETAKQGGEIQLDIGSSLLSTSDPHKGWDLPVGYQKDKGKSVHHLMSYQTMTNIVADNPRYFESDPWQLSQPETLLIAILNASQGMPRDRQAAIITQLQHVAQQSGDERLTCLGDGIKIVG